MRSRFRRLAISPARGGGTLDRLATWARVVMEPNKIEADNAGRALTSGEFLHPLKTGDLTDWAITKLPDGNATGPRCFYRRSTEAGGGARRGGVQFQLRGNCGGTRRWRPAFFTQYAREFSEAPKSGKIGG